MLSILPYTLLPSSTIDRSHSRDLETSVSTLLLDFCLLINDYTAPFIPVYTLGSSRLIKIDLICL